MSCCFSALIISFDGFVPQIKIYLNFLKAFNKKIEIFLRIIFGILGGIIRLYCFILCVHRNIVVQPIFEFCINAFTLML